jgi:hypothetical protein
VNVPDPNAPTLDYVPPDALGTGSLRFRLVAVLLALAGVALNIGLIAVAVSGSFSASRAHRDLMLNPSAHGRQVDPETIASLRRPVRLWVSQLAMVAAAAVGLLLALRLLTAVPRLRRDPVGSEQVLENYARWQNVAALAAGVAFFWCGIETQAFWEAATRHIPVGSGPPVLGTAVLVAFELAPQWWVRRALARRDF